MGHAGQYHDYETGFIYLRARYYSPAVGRFINEDPIRDGLNWYNYCGNDPVNFVDPSGLKLECSEEDSEHVIGYLTELCGGSLKFSYQDGEIIITEVYESEKYVAHTVILDIVNSEKIVKVTIGYSKYGATNMAFPVEENGRYNVFISPQVLCEETPFTLTESSDGQVNREKIPAYILVGHELIHAYRAINKQYVYKGDVISDFGIIPKEEAITTGLPYIDSDGKRYSLGSYSGTITENGLRLENGLPMRITYFNCD